MAGLPTPVLETLAGAAMAPGLRSLLLFDVEPPALLGVAGALAQMVEAIEGRPVAPLSLASFSGEDALWGGLGLRRRRGGPALEWQPGPLTGELSGAAIPLVIIPDLPRLSLPALRACVALIGAEEAHLERHSRSQAWRPAIVWLAACPAGQVRIVSAHLLDRFALRLHGAALATPDRAAALRAAAARPDDRPPPLPRLPDSFIHELRAAHARQPLVGREAQAEALRFFPDPATSPRRPIALARLAATVAARAGDSRAGASHVAQAARLLGLRDPSLAPAASARADAARPAEPPPSADEPARAEEPAAAADAAADATADAAAPDAAAPAPEEPPLIGGEEQALAPVALHPYPEDEGPAEHGVEPLRLPGRRHRQTASASGPVIGTEPADDMSDLALISTLIEAAKYQIFRRRRLRARMGDGSAPIRRFIFAPGDLRRYRRAPIVEQLLVIVLDYTSLRDCDWKDELFEHLLWAYQQRAAVTLIQVGVEQPADELRAQALSVPNVLVPSLNAALSLGPGRATPLAHGLDLALQALRRAVHTGRNAIQRARVVVLSDGRGNVPLEDSQRGVMRGPVRRRGVDDALEVAAAIGRLGHVECVLLSPQPRQHPDLPPVLAGALGASLVPLPPRAEGLP